jgi:hypothetical protein
MRNSSQIEPGWYVEDRQFAIGQFLILWKARVDVLHGRQVTRRGQAHLQRRQALGAEGAQARSYGFEERLQAIQHVCGIVYHLWPLGFTNTEQSQEQVHTVAAQVRASVERSCINWQDAFYGAQATTKALGDNHLPLKLAVSSPVFRICPSDRQ